MKIQTTELTDAELDWAVATCEGEDYSPVSTYDGIGNEYPATNYSSNWDLAGPIIDREGIEITRGGPLRLPCVSGSGDGYAPVWVATIDLDEGDAMVVRVRGRTHLESSMRCYVLSKLGECVDVPDDLAPELAA